MMHPTNRLRFVERQIKPLVGGPTTRRILQQLWRPAGYSEEQEWRDVPLEKEDEQT